jgi:hypothetical protein
MPGADNLLSGAADPDGLRALSESFDSGRLTHILSALSKARAELTQSPFDRTVAELCLASLCDARLDGYPEALLARIEALENEEGRPASPSPSLADVPDSAAETKKKAPAEKRAPKSPAAAAEAPAGPASGGEFWQGILSRLKKSGGMLTLPFVSDARASLEGDILTVTVSDPFAVDMLARESASAALKAAAEAELGRPVALITELGEAAAAPAEDAVSPDVINRLSSRLGDLLKLE